MANYIDNKNCKLYGTEYCELLNMASCENCAFGKIKTDAEDVDDFETSIDGKVTVFDNDGTDMVMFNPEIIKQEGQYETEEGCLSLPGIRKTKRYHKIKVQYQNASFQTRIKTFSGWTAQIIQHEIDHCNGILI